MQTKLVKTKHQKNIHRNRPIVMVNYRLVFFTFLFFLLILPDFMLFNRIIWAQELVYEFELGREQDSEQTGKQEQPPEQRIDKIFTEIFGQEDDEKIIPLALYINGRFAGEVEAQKAGLDLVLPTELLYGWLAPIADKNVMQSLESAQAMTMTEMRESGLQVTYNSYALEVMIYLPPEQMVPSKIRLRHVWMEDPQAFQAPAPLSGYLNIFSRAQYQSRQSLQPKTDIESVWSLHTTFEPVINIRSFVLEGSVQTTLQTDREGIVSVDKVLLTRDIMEPQLRFSLGALRTPAIGYQNNIAMYAIGLQTLSILRDFQDPANFEGTEIILEEDAAVEIFINDRLVRTLRLSPGRHEITDFPYVTGVNHVRVVVRETGKEPRTVYLRVPFDARLLPPGVFDFALAVGTPDFTRPDPLVSAYGVYGFTTDFTGGMYLSAGLDRQIIGMESILATTIGNFKADIGLSTSLEGDIDYAFGLGYRFARPEQRFFPSVGVAAEYKGEKFLPPETRITANNKTWGFSASVSQRLPWEISMSGSFSRNYFRESDPANALSLRLLRQFGTGLSVRLSTGLKWTDEQIPNFEAGIFISSNPPEERYSMSMNHDLVKTGGDTLGSSVSYTLRPEKNKTGPVYSASLQGWPYQEQVQTRSAFSMAYGNKWFNSSYTGRIATATEQDPWEHSSVIAASSALLFSDGGFAISRPVNDSFVFVVPPAALSDFPVLVNPSGNSYLATAERGKKGVITNISSYRPFRLSFDVSEVPPGIEIGSTYTSLFPTYRSGTTVMVEVLTTAYVQGILLDQERGPISYQAGEAYFLTDPQAEGVLFFTDDKGVFEIPGLQPGEYKLSLFMTPQVGLNFSITEDDYGKVDLGEIVYSPTDNNDSVNNGNTENQLSESGQDDQKEKQEEQKSHQEEQEKQEE